jgi:hypothetical protein
LGTFSIGLKKKGKMKHERISLELIKKSAISFVKEKENDNEQKYKKKKKNLEK